MFAALMLASAAHAAIGGSAHDFSGTGWSQGQVCLPCHSTHNTTIKAADGTVLQGPLWNHELSKATYTLYVDQTTGAGVTGKVDGNSMLCLSCHDGTVALDSFGGVTGNTKISGAANLGTDLSNDHPIGEYGVYPTSDGKTSTASYMVNPQDRANAAGGAIMPLRTLDGKYVVGCTSCHEPHNRKNQQHMLWVKNDGAGTTVDGRPVSGSLLCFNCHKK
jgi:hypothetical protein